MLSLHKLSISYPNQLWLKIPEEIPEKSWQKAQLYSNPTSRCQAYLNEVCWQTFIPWLEAWLEEDSQDNIFIEKQYFPNIWEFVNGSLINLGNSKIAIIPSETSDPEEFDIPQEWVDIPQWQADYYLAMEVNTDFAEEAWLRCRGYISRQELKDRGEYNSSDRSYHISLEYLEEDIAEILSLQPVTQTQPELVTPTELSADKANSLLEKLSSPSVYYPRLAIPFAQWMMAITNSQWREKLYQQRTRSNKVSSFSSQAVNLKQWLHKLADTVEEGWQTLETLFTPIEPIAVRGGYRDTSETITKEAIPPLIEMLQPSNPEKERIQAAGVLGKIGMGYPEVIEALTELLDTAREAETRWEAALSLGKIDPGNPRGGVEKGKLIDLGIQLDGQKLVLIVAIMAQTQNRVGVWVQIKSANQLFKLPPYLKLKVLSQGKTYLEAEARSDLEGKGKDKCLQLRFTPPSGTNFQVRVTLDRASFTEHFDT